MKLTIGKMAELNSISKQTLRLYDKMGLLEPSEIDKKTGYRYYTYKQCARLDMILHLKQMGWTLKEIKSFFEKHNNTFLVEKLKEYTAKIDDDIEELILRKKKINRFLNSIEKYANAPKDGSITVEFIPKRVIYRIKTDVNFYEYDINMYEKILRKLKKNLMNCNKDKLYFNNAGTSMKKEYFLESKYISNDLFVFVDESDFNCVDLDYIEAGLFLCIYCDAFEKEKLYMKKLLDKIKKEDYEVVGDYICESIAEIPIFNDNDERGMFIRLQIPIKIN